MKIKVYKSKKALELWDQNKLLKTFNIGIGKNENGHKTERGDMKTPEGEYKVCFKNPKSDFHLSLALNYPNKNDAKAGLDSGLITKDDYKLICEKIDSGYGSWWKTKLGGEIYIHGDLESKPWSEGCIRMYNPDIEYLYKIIEKGTTVEIFR